jgi:hypothetical protein
MERYLQGPEPQDPAKKVDEGSLWPWWSMTKSVVVRNHYGPVWKPSEYKAEKRLIVELAKACAQN